MGDCGVCIGTDDWEQGSFQCVTNPKARKEHKCCECSRTIVKRQMYERYAGCWGGSMECYKTCMDCVNIRDGLRCGNGFIFGELWNDIREIFGSINISCLDKIKTPSAKSFFLDQWHKWKFEQD